MSRGHAIPRARSPAGVRHGPDPREGGIGPVTWLPGHSAYRDPLRPVGAAGSSQGLFESCAASFKRA